jgi:hypothetical protein
MKGEKAADEICELMKKALNARTLKQKGDVQMKRKRILLSVLSILMLVTLSCGFLSKTEPTEVPVPTKEPEPTKGPQPTKEPEPTKKPEPTTPPEPDVELGEEIRSEDGGYSFNTIPGYTTEEAFGMASVEAPDADPDMGPALMLMGGFGEESATPEELYEEFTSELGADIEVSPLRKIQVDGQPGVIADVSGTEDGAEVIGRIVVAAPTPNHHFVMIAAAPADRWDELAPLFDAVLASIHFFPPAGADVPPMGEGTRQWAVSATASSQYSDTGWSAMQATGAPNTPECGDYTTAWATEDYDAVEWIELDYDTPVIPTEVNIFQTYNPDQVIQVALRDLEGDYQTIYLGTPEDKSDDCPFVLNIPVEGIDWQVDGVKITVDQRVIQDWVEIDAVELVGIAERPSMDE